MFTIVGCVVVALGGYGPARAESTVTVVRAGHLIDTDSGRVLGTQTIIVRDGLIADIGATVEMPAGARVVDLSGYTVLPGLIDAHTHLTIDAKNQDPLGELEHTAAERALGRYQTPAPSFSPASRPSGIWARIARWSTSRCVMRSIAAMSSGHTCTSLEPT